MEYWIVFDLASGEELWRGSGSSGTAGLQQVPEGAGIVVVPRAVIAGPVVDLSLLRAAVCADIDAAAEQVRGRFITALPGQVGAYLLKANAARRWLADRSASTTMLKPEATKRGMTIEALCDEVLQREADWEAAAGPIESLRLGAKEAVAAATTIGGIVAAQTINWAEIGAATSA